MCSANENDVRGDGVIDMSDFRRWRDWLLFGEGPHGLNGSAQSKKLDANGDGFVDERESTVFPRGDFNGDGYLHRKDETAVPGIFRSIPFSDLQILALSSTWEVWADPVYADTAELV